MHLRACRVPCFKKCVFTTFTERGSRGLCVSQPVKNMETKGCVLIKRVCFTTFKARGSKGWMGCRGFAVGRSAGRYRGACLERHVGSHRARILCRQDSGASFSPLQTPNPIVPGCFAAKTLRRRLWCVSPLTNSKSCRSLLLCRQDS